MLKLLQSIFRQSAESSDRYDEELIEKAIERVLEGTDPRLRALSGYRRRLRPAVIEAVGYTMELVDGLPEPLDLVCDRFSHDDYIRSFFVSPDHITEFLTQSRSLQYFMENRSGIDPERVFALLTLTRVERNVLGMEMEGEILRRDVKQVSVSFSNPRLSATMDEEAGCRVEIKKDVFDYFVNLALRDLIAARDKHHAVKNRPGILTNKLRTLESANWGIESLLAGETEKAVDTERTEQELTKLESELTKRSARPVTLDEYLDTITASLNGVRENLRKETVTVKLNRMGIKASEDSTDAAVVLQLNEYCSGDGRRVIALPVMIPFGQIPAPKDFLSEASRYL